MGYSPWGHKEWDMTERLTLLLATRLLKQGSPSCLGQEALSFCREEGFFLFSKSLCCLEIIGSGKG